VPAGFEILGDLAEGLVELAQDLAVGSAGARFGGRIARGEAVDAAQEAIDALGAFHAPIDFLLRRRGEEHEHAGGIGAELLGQQSAPTTLPLDFDILAPSAITMPCVKRRRAGSLFWIRPISRIILVKKRE
jgi:hypothetical protein